MHDTILFYTVSDIYTWNRLLQPYEPGYIESKYRLRDSRGSFQDVSLTGPGTRKGESGLPWRGHDPTALGRHWAIPNGLIDGLENATPQAKMDAFDVADLLYYPRDGEGFPRIKQYVGLGTPIQDVVTDISAVNSQAQERLGYPTQKPLQLLERIISASSNAGDVLLDPFCGCGTSIHSAQKLGRSWIGIDITHLAISLIERRLKDAFLGITFEVHGTPKDIDGARDLALRDKYQFQWWAVSLIDAQPFAGKKKGADGGIDGLIYFRSDAKTTERAVVSVKGGGVSVPMVRDLKGVLDREKAPIGVFLTLEPPTRPMRQEAASAGFYTLGAKQYPRLQIISIEEALAGKGPSIPLVDTGASFRRAPREDITTQPKLDI